MKILLLLLVPFGLAAQTVVHGSQTYVDMSTPTTPSAGRTSVYSKSGKLCSNSSGSGENCTGGTGQSGVYGTVTYSATPTFTCNSNTVNSFKITLTGNVTSSTLASCTSGQFVNFSICQDGSGNHTFAWPSNVSLASTIDATASGCSNQSFIFDGSNAVPIGMMFVTGLSGGAIILPGSTSGTTTVTPSATGGGALVLAPGSGTVPKSGAASINHTFCWKDATNFTIGYCSTVVASDGTCTCN